MNPLEDRREWASGIYPEPPPPLSFRDARAVLCQYERSSTWFRTAAGGLVTFIAVAVAPGLLALSVFDVHGKLGSYALGLASLCTAWLPSRAWKQRWWERWVRRRLAWRTAFDPRVPTVSVQLGERDSAAAMRAIRHSGLTYQYTRLSAPDGHSVTVAVAQWAFGPLQDDLAFRDHVCEVFRSAGVSANVGGVEVDAKQ